MSRKKRVAMIVPNVCDPDYRVIKQAESLAQAGYEVRVYCIWRHGRGIPLQETLNGVTYIRREWNPIALIKHKLFGVPLPSDVLRLEKRYEPEEDNAR